MLSLPKFYTIVCLMILHEYMICSCSFVHQFWTKHDEKNPEEVGLSETTWSVPTALYTYTCGIKPREADNIA